MLLLIIFFFAQYFKMVLALEERILLKQSVLNKEGKYSQKVKDLFAEKFE